LRGSIEESCIVSFRFPARQAARQFQSPIATELGSSASNSLHFPSIQGSIAEQVGDRIAALPERSFVAIRDVDGPRSAVESAFSRLASAGDVLRVRKGLYWKGTTTPLGMTPPGAEEVALELGGPGSGPAGVAAAQWLGLTLQVPSTFLAAVPGRAPSPCPGVRFTQRPIDRLLHSLTPAEVAVLEVLRAGPPVVETPWEELPDVIARLAASGSVRLDALDEAAATEPHRQARARWSEIRAHPALMPSPRLWGAVAPARYAQRAPRR